MSHDMSSQLSNLRQQIETLPDIVSNEVIFERRDDGRDELPLVKTTGDLENAQQGDPYFPGISEGGYIMNFKERRPQKAPATQPARLGNEAKIITPGGDEVYVQLTPQQHYEFINSRIKAQDSARWASNAYTAFTVAGTVLLAFGVALGIRRETRNQL
jgi:hypothetical protein